MSRPNRASMNAAAQRLMDELNAIDARKREIVVRASVLDEGWPFIQRLAWSFFRAGGPPTVDPHEHLAAWGRLLEWAVFAVRLPPDRMTLAERALAAAHELSDQQRELRRRVFPPRYSIYETVEQVSDLGIVVYDTYAHEEILLLVHPDAWPKFPMTAMFGAVFPIRDGVYTPGSSFMAISKDREPGDDDGDRAGEDDPAAMRLLMGPIVESRFGVASAEYASIDRVQAAWEGFRHALLETGTPMPSFDDLKSSIDAAEYEFDPHDFFRAADISWITPFESTLACRMCTQAATMLGKHSYCEVHIRETDPLDPDD